MINIVDVTCHYGVRPVLRNFSLNVKKGEVVALMGPNGSGKSTLMGVTAGILAPLKGYVEIDGKRRRRSVDEELAIRRQVVYLAADPFIPGGKTGREWLLAVGRLYEVEDERLMVHAERLLTLFDLADRADSPIHAYSTGQKKKIAVCAALITEAPVMLLDEPFSGGLDPSAILALRRILLHCKQHDDVTVVMATPVPELVEELANRIVVLRDGRIIANDSLEGLRRQMSGVQALSDIYAQLASPHTAENINRYFEGALR
jgi:ABC-2 type transport system ATP-binding protein